MRVKKRISEIINVSRDGDKASLAFDNFIIGLIVLSVVSIVLESYDSLSARYAQVFHILEVVITIVFTIEYLLRIWTADLLYAGEKHPYLKYIFSFMAMVDLLAILPFYLPFIPVDLRFLRMLRLIRMTRLVRVFKLGRYTASLRMISEVVKKTISQLVSSVAVCFVLMLFSAILMYSVQNPAQPEAFPNVISSLWWAVCTLTTVGYGDVYPITALGKIFASIISILGIGMVAVPTGIISASFITYVEGDKKQAQTPGEPKHYCPYCGKKIDQ